MPRLKVGDKLPRFTFNTAYRNGVGIYDSIAGHPLTLLWVLRYIGCTTCRYDVHVLSQRYEEFRRLGAQLFVVMQSEPQTVREDLKDAAIPFDIICDTDMELYELLEVRAAPSKEARTPTDPVQVEKLAEKKRKIKELGFVHGKYEGNEQQLPALFIVDEEGTVRYAHYAVNSIDMPTADEALKLLSLLRQE